MTLRHVLVAAIFFSAARVYAAKDEFWNPKIYCEASKQRMEYGLDLTTRAYLKVGHHDKKWDADALKAIMALARSWQEFPRENGDENDVGYDRGAVAIAEGCDDPLLIFAHARALAQFGGPVSDVVALDKRAVEGFRSSEYPPMLVVTAMFRWANDTARAQPDNETAIAEARQHVDEAIDLLPKALAEPKVSAFGAVSLLELIAVTSGHVEGDREVYVKRALPVFEASPVPKGNLLAAKANVYFDEAVEARGCDTADTVTPDRWKQMESGLDAASQAAEESLKIDPNSSDAARVLDYIELYRPSNPEARAAAHELAVKLDPDDQRLHYGHLIQLLPQWDGSIDEMITYGRKCSTDYQGKGLAALTLPEAHWMAAFVAITDSGKRMERSYFERSPEIFDEIKPIYEAYFKCSDASNFHKTRYAVIAAYTGHWKEADVMFKSLGEHRSRYVLNNDEPKLTSLAAEAAQKAAEN